MKVINLTKDSLIYTSNVYLLLGDHNTLDDVNTLIDVGRDPSIIEKIKAAPTGVGKKQVDQVILTHSHYDHTSMLDEVRRVFNPRVLAFSASLEGVDHRLVGGERLRAADTRIEVIHTPAHTEDSICLFDEPSGGLFVGDSPVVINSPDQNYDHRFVLALEKICRRNVRTIYPGHGAPRTEGVGQCLRRSRQFAA